MRAAARACAIHPIESDQERHADRSVRRDLGAPLVTPMPQPSGSWSILLFMSDLPDGLADLRRARDRMGERQAGLIQALYLVRQDAAKRIEEIQQREAEQTEEIGRLAAELETAMDALDAVIAQSDSRVDMFMKSPGGEWSAVECKSTGNMPIDRSPTSTSGAIERVLASEPREFETSEIVELVAKFGADSQPATTRSILAKMHKAGRVQKVKRGLYRGSFTVSGPGSSKTAAFVSSRRSGRLYRATGDPRPTDSVSDPGAGSGAFLERAQLAIEAAAPSPIEPKEAIHEPAPGDYAQINFEVAQPHLDDQVNNEERSS